MEADEVRVKCSWTKTERYTFQLVFYAWVHFCFDYASIPINHPVAFFLAVARGTDSYCVSGFAWFLLLVSCSKAYWMHDKVCLLEEVGRLAGGSNFYVVLAFSIFCGVHAGCLCQTDNVPRESVTCCWQCTEAITPPLTSIHLFTYSPIHLSLTPWEMCVTLTDALPRAAS